MISAPIYDILLSEYKCMPVGGMEDNMKFGFFDDPNKEYVITTPKTPLPWINYLGSNNFFSLISNTCGGYSFYKDAKLLRLTRYRYNNIPNDEGGPLLLHQRW